jgi:organic hydroperoxide reductase OsmC/OhrA
LRIHDKHYVWADREASGVAAAWDERKRIQGDHGTFQSIAASAKTGCPVSKLMKVEIQFGATLVS